MATPCACGQATAEPTCEIIAGPGIDVVCAFGQCTVTAESALPWVDWTPTVANFTLGNAENGSRYLINGKTLDVVFAIRFGTTSTYTTTAWEIGMPGGLTPFFDPNLIMDGHIRGRVSFKDASAGSPWFKGELFLVSGSARPIRFRFSDDAGGIGASGDVRQNTPFTFTTSDEIVAQARFEVV